jgi:hypothetical protein
MLSDKQKDRYTRDGYVLLSGLIPEETIAKAESAMWSVLGMEPDDPASWSPLPDSSDRVRVKARHGVIEHYGVKHPDLMACRTPAFYDMQNRLAQENSDAFHCQKPQPVAAWTLSVFPVSRAWDYEGGHIDGGHRPLDVFPGSFRVSSLTYLDSGVAQGGGTAVWPGSHQKLSQAAIQNPDRYPTVSDLKEPQQSFDLGEPIELTPSRGDVLFLHYLLVHSGSLNTRNKPRFALRWMCTCEACQIWQKHGRWNIWMP